MSFILLMFLSVINCSFLLSMLLLSSHVANSPASPCNLSPSAFIIFSQDSCSSLHCLLLSCIALPPSTSSVCKRFDITLHVHMGFHMIAGLSNSNMLSRYAPDQSLMKYDDLTYAVYNNNNKTRMSE